MGCSASRPEKNETKQLHGSRLELETPQKNNDDNNILRTLYDLTSSETEDAYLSGSVEQDENKTPINTVQSLSKHSSPSLLDVKLAERSQPRPRSASKPKPCPHPQQLKSSKQKSISNRSMSSCGGDSTASTADNSSNTLDHNDDDLTGSHTNTKISHDHKDSYNSLSDVNFALTNWSVDEEEKEETGSTPLLRCDRPGVGLASTPTTTAALVVSATPVSSPIVTGKSTHHNVGADLNKNIFRSPRILSKHIETKFTPEQSLISDKPIVNISDSACSEDHYDSTISSSLPTTPSTPTTAATTTTLPTSQSTPTATSSSTATATANTPAVIVIGNETGYTTSTTDPNSGDTVGHTLRVDSPANRVPAGAALSGSESDHRKTLYADDNLPSSPPPGIIDKKQKKEDEGKNNIKNKGEEEVLKDEGTEAGGDSGDLISEILPPIISLPLSHSPSSSLTLTQGVNIVEEEDDEGKILMKEKGYQQISLQESVKEQGDDFSQIKNRLAALTGVVESDRKSSSMDLGQELKLNTIGVDNPDEVVSPTSPGMQLSARERLKLRLAESKSAKLKKSQSSVDSVRVGSVGAVTMKEEKEEKEGEEMSEETNTTNVVDSPDRPESIRDRMAYRLAKSKSLRESLSPMNHNSRFEQNFFSESEPSLEHSESLVNGPTLSLSSPPTPPAIASELRQSMFKSRELRRSLENVLQSDCEAKTSVVRSGTGEIDTRSDTDSSSGHGDNDDFFDDDSNEAEDDTKYEIDYGNTDDDNNDDDGDDYDDTASICSTVSTHSEEPESTPNASFDVDVNHSISVNTDAAQESELILSTSSSFPTAPATSKNPPSPTTSVTASPTKLKRPTSLVTTTPAKQVESEIPTPHPVTGKMKMKSPIPRQQASSKVANRPLLPSATKTSINDKATMHRGSAQTAVGNTSSHSTKSLGSNGKQAEIFFEKNSHSEKQDPAKSNPGYRLKMIVKEKVIQPKKEERRISRIPSFTSVSTPNPSANITTTTNASSPSRAALTRRPSGIHRLAAASKK